MHPFCKLYPKNSAITNVYNEYKIYEIPVSIVFFPCEEIQIYTKTELCIFNP